MKELYRRVFTFFIFLIFFLTLVIFSREQIPYLKEKGIFPGTKDLLPAKLKAHFFAGKKMMIPASPEKTNLYSGTQHKHLAKFFDALQELKSGKKRVVRILHFGDSLIWGDFVTLGFKQRFQKEFGDGGRGLVPIVPRLERRILEHRNYTSENYFQWDAIEPWGKEKSSLGFVGESARLNGNGVYTRHELPEGFKKWRKLGLYFHSYSNIPSSLSYELKYPMGKINRNLNIEGSCSYSEVNLPDIDSVKLTFHDIKPPFPYLDIINIETAVGIAYSSISRTSMEMKDLLTIPYATFSCGMQHFQPDLIVFQFGVNESQNMWLTSVVTPNYYRYSFEKVLKTFKRALPQTNMIVLSPLERIRKNSYGYFDTMPEVLVIRELQKAISLQNNVAFYDSLKAMGKQGKNRELYQKGYLQVDRTHLTRKGGDVYASIVYEDIFAAYKEYIGDKEYKKKVEYEEKLEKQSAAILFNTSSYAYFLLFLFFLSLILRGYEGIRIFILLIASYYFYASWNPSLLFLILFSTFVDYFVGLLIYESQKEKKAGTGYLFISLFLNLGLLVFFKYLGFFSEVLHGLRINGKEIPALEVLSMPFTVNGILYSIKVSEILLPVGISFYTFQTLSYSIDVWKGKIQPESNFLKFSLYVTFFPQLVAGPIVRASDFLPSLKNRGEHFRLNPYYFSLALFFIITGLLKKTGADWLGANLSDRFFDNPSLQGNFYGLLSIYAYGLQIYGDFSGYTDMAIGSAMLLGFRLSLNFDRPYIAYSITDFWRRWHISLGKWFMHYLYIPLGGNRNMVYRNLFITMFICGLWHGAGYTFILWGLYHGFLLALERFLGFNKKSDNPVFSMIQYFITFHLVMLGWLLFRSKSLELFKDAFQALHSNLSLKLPSVDILGVLFFSYIIVFLPIKLHKKIKEFWLILPPSAQAFLFVISLLVVYNLNTAEIQPFIYFQF